MTQKQGSVGRSQRPSRSGLLGLSADQRRALTDGNARISTSRKRHSCFCIGLLLWTTSLFPSTTPHHTALATSQPTQSHNLRVDTHDAVNQGVTRPLASPLRPHLHPPPSTRSMSPTPTTDLLRSASGRQASPHAHSPSQQLTHGLTPPTTAPPLPTPMDAPPNHRPPHHLHPDRKHTQPRRPQVHPQPPGPAGRSHNPLRRVPLAPRDHCAAAPLPARSTPHEH